MKPRLEAPLEHMFQGAGSKGIKLRRRHAARQGEWPEPALGSSVRLLVLAWGLKILFLALFFVARSVNAMYGDSVAFILRELTGIRLLRRFASLETG